MTTLAQQIQQSARDIVTHISSLVQTEIPEGVTSGQLLPSLLPLLSEIRTLLGLAQQTEQVDVLSAHEPPLTDKLRDLAVGAKALQRGDPGAQEQVTRVAMALAEAVAALAKALAPQPKEPIPPEYQDFFDKCRDFLLLSKTVMRSFTVNPLQVEDDLLPVVSAFKGLITQWQSQTVLQSILPDQKLPLIIQLQYVVQEAKKTTAGEVPARQQFVFTLFALGEQIHLWLGTRYSISLASEIAMLSKEKSVALDRLINLNSPRERDTVSTPVSLSGESIEAASPASLPASPSQFTSSDSLSSLASSSAPSVSPSPGFLSPLQSPRATPSPSGDSLFNVDSPHSPSTPSNDYEAFLKLRRQPSITNEGLHEIQKKSFYNHGTLKKWGAKYFAKARADFTPGAEHGELALNFQKGDLIAVFEDDGDLWQGANPETGKFGYFPYGLVSVIKDSLTLAQRAKEEATRKPLNEAMFRKELQEKQAREEAERKKKEEEEEAARQAARSQPKELMGKFTVKPPKKKWEEMDVTLREFTLMYSKYTDKKRDTKTVTTINLPSCVITPASEKEGGKEYLGRAFKVTERYSNIETMFAASTKQECTEWMEALTLASLCLSKDDLNSPDQYAFGNSSPKVRGMKLEGFDSRGNSFVSKVSEKEKKRMSSGSEGSLTREEIEQYTKILPSKAMIDKMAGSSKKRSSLFRAFRG